MTKTSELPSQTRQVELTSPNKIAEFANELKDLIVENKLYANIREKNYVNVEGWQIAGAFMGIFPIVEAVENLSDEGAYKYRAEVSLYDNEGRKVGSGVAICTNKEQGKGSFDEYAVASMAQTRAVGKAFRMKIGWILKIAGYEPTPSEEMDVVEAEVLDGKKTEIQRAKERLAEAKTLDELKTAYVEIGKVRDNEEVAKLKDLLKKRFGDEGED